MQDEKYSPPDDALEALARCLLPAMRAYYDSAEGQREFAKWQARQGAETSPVRENMPDKNIQKIA